MIIKAEISLYPLREEYGKEIIQYIDQIQTHPGLSVETNSMSTLISGEYDEIMSLFNEEIRRVFTALKAVIILKISNGCLVNKYPE